MSCSTCQNLEVELCEACGQSRENEDRVAQVLFAAAASALAALGSRFLAYGDTHLAIVLLAYWATGGFLLLLLVSLVDLSKGTPSDEGS